MQHITAPSQWDSPDQTLDFLSPEEELDAQLDILSQESEDLDHIPVGFGKYSKLSPAQIHQLDPQYLKWALKETSRIVCSPELRAKGLK